MLAACFSFFGISFFEFPLKSFDLREQEWEIGPYRVPYDTVVDQVIAVDEHISEPHYPLVLAQPVGGFWIVAPQTPDSLADDLQVPLYALA